MKFGKVQKADIKIISDFLTDEGFSNETVLVMINLMNYTNTGIISKEQKTMWTELDVINDDGYIVYGDKEESNFSPEGIMLMAMTWDGLLHREFSDKKKVFVYSTTRKGDEVAGEDPSRFEKNIMIEILINNGSVSKLARKLNITNKRIDEDLDSMNHRGLVYQK